MKLARVLPIAFAFLPLTSLLAQEVLNETIVVADAPDGAYSSTAPASVFRSEIPILDAPRSAQVFSREVIEDLRPQTIEEVITRAPNVVFLGDNDGRENSFIIRGFQDAPVLRDGFRVESFGGITDPEIYGLERMEVLKGPDSILYGESAPGGLINLVSKRPLDHSHAEFGVEAGSFGSVSPRFDFGGPLTGYGTTPAVGKNPAVTSETGVRYRVVGLYDYDQGFRDYDNPNERLFIAPSVTVDFSEATSLTVLADITHDDNFADFGIGIDRNGELVAPVDRPANHPQDTIKRRNYTVGYDFDHDLNDSWTFQHRLRYIDSGYEYSNLLLPIAFDDLTGLYTRFPAQQYQNNEEIAAQFNLSGDHEIGGFRNRIFGGMDLRRSTVENGTRFDPTPFVINYLNPDYSILPPATEDIPDAPGFYSNDTINRYGVYLQDHFNVTEKLIISGGIRHDDVERVPVSGAAPQINEAWIPQGGIVYKLTKSLSVFGSYSQSFTPNFVDDINGNPLTPETGEGYEAGVKSAFFEDRLLLGASYFDITKQNVATADLNDPAFPFGASIATGEQQSQGIELDAAGQITPNLSLLASYGYADARVTADNSTPVGNRLVGVPEHTAAFWAKHDFLAGPLQGFGVGAGFQIVGDRAVDAANTVEVSGYGLLNAGLFYARDNWEASLLFNNLTDEGYVQSAWGGTSRSVYPGAPFNAVGTFTIHF